MTKKRIFIFLLIILTIGIISGILFYTFYQIPLNQKKTAQSIPSFISTSTIPLSVLNNLWNNSERCPKKGFTLLKQKEDIVEVNNLRFLVNFIHINFIQEATCEDAEQIALFINAKIHSFGPTTNSYTFQISTRTPEELQIAIDKIRSLNDPKIEGVMRLYPLKPSPF